MAGEESQPRVPRSPHLWEVEHPSGCFPDYNNDHQSWAIFVKEYKEGNGADTQANLLFRWDWLEVGQDGSHNSYGGDTLHLFFVAQRKGEIYSESIAVRKEDEPEIREWLAVRLESLKAVVAPFLGSQAIEKP